MSRMSRKKNLTKLERLANLAVDNGWEAELISKERANVEMLSVRRDSEADGYPHAMVIVGDDTHLWGQLVTNYGSGDDVYPVGYNKAKGVIEHLKHGFKYAPFWRFMRMNGGAYTESMIAERMGIAERQVRNARIYGYWSGRGNARKGNRIPEDVVVDMACVKVLSEHPLSVYGDDWLEFGEISLDTDDEV